MTLTSLIPISAVHYNAECEETKFQDAAKENCKLQLILIISCIFLQDKYLCNYQ